MLNKHLFLSPKAQRRIKKAHRKRIQAKVESQKKLTLVEEKLVVENNILDPKSSHARIPRKKYIGEQL